MNARLEIGRVFYAVAMIAFGVQHLVYCAFITRVVPKLPAWVPAQVVLVYIVGVILLVSGGAIAARVRMHVAGRALAALLAISVVAFYAPALALNPYQGGFITNTFKAVALCGGALLIMQIAAVEGLGEGAPARIVHLGRFLFASFIIVAGIQHFLYAPFVATLVPAWIPPSQLFWTYLAGAALIAGGLGIVIRRTSFVAANLTGVMIFLWVPLLHIPRALSDLHNTNETTAVFEALAMSGIAFMIASVRSDDLAAHRPYSVAAHDRE